MPPRALWKGSISFGLVTVPINLVSASEPREALDEPQHTSLVRLPLFHLAHYRIISHDLVTLCKFIRFLNFMIL